MWPRKTIHKKMQGVRNRLVFIALSAMYWHEMMQESANMTPVFKAILGDS